MKDERHLLIYEMSKTWVVQRLEHINLSAVPPWLGPKVATASRFKHSLGVGRLSLLVSGGTEHEKLLLTAAAVLHDVGNGPFPHITDQFMKEKMGFTHEGALRFAFKYSPFKDSRVLEKYGLDLSEVSSVLEGQHRLSSLLYGSPDLDNADNIYRFIKTCRGNILGKPSYSPRDIAASMSLDLHEQRIPDVLRSRWLSDYEKVYSYVWNDGPNMATWTMLGRSLRILNEELTPAFFRMTNREAFSLIKLKLPELAAGLKREEYQIVLDKKYIQFKGEAQGLLEPSNLRKTEETLCKETGLKEWAVGLTVDKPTSLKTDHWRVYLVSHKGNEAPKSLLDEMLSSSKPLH